MVVLYLKKANQFDAMSCIRRLDLLPEYRGVVMRSVRSVLSLQVDLNSD